jgi:hypothetical protein
MVPINTLLPVKWRQLTLARAQPMTSHLATRFVRTTRHQTEEPCLNCDTVYRGNFCPECGQEAATGAPTALGFIYEFLTRNIFERGKLPRTIWHLLRYPGGLTVDFLEGRRQRFIRPVRLYLGMSVLYFLVLSLQSGRLLDQFSDLEIGQSGKPGHVSASASASAPGAASAAASAKQGHVAQVVKHAVEQAQADSTVNQVLQQANVPQTIAKAIEQERAADAPKDKKKRHLNSKIEFDSLNDFYAKWPDTGWRGELKRRVQHLSQMPSGEAGRVVLKGMLNQAPKTMFFLVPVFAMLLKMLFMLRKIPYGAHLLFAFHYHAMLFLGLFLLLVLPLPGLVEAGIWIGMVLYLPLALRTTYGCGWWGALMRWWVMSIFYPVAIGLAMLLALVLAFLS